MCACIEADIVAHCACRFDADGLVDEVVGDRLAIDVVGRVWEFVLLVVMEDDDDEEESACWAC